MSESLVAVIVVPETVIIEFVVPAPLTKLSEKISFEILPKPYDVGYVCPPGLPVLPVEFSDPLVQFPEASTVITTVFT
jgi:hypothetical protein